MKKKYFLMAFAVMTAMCLTTACSSDDDDNENKQDEQVNLPVPQNAANAIEFKLDTPQTPTASGGEEDAPILNTIDITECDEVLLELKHPKAGDIVFVKGKAKKNGNKYELSGDMVKGFVEMVPTGARITRTTSTGLIIDIEVKFSVTEVYTYKNTNGEIITAEQITPIDGDEAEKRLIRTWNVLGAIFDLQGDDGVKPAVFFESTNGVLNLETTFLKEAEKRNVNLTADEKDELRKKLKTVTITGTRIFSLDYVDGSVDAASWQWTDEKKKEAFRITLRDGKMGNKFIQNASLVTAEFSGNRCNLKLATSFDDSSHKQWKATVTLQLQDQGTTKK